LSARSFLRGDLTALLIGEIDTQRAAVKLFIVQVANGRLSSGSVGEFAESETSRFAGLTIALYSEKRTQSELFQSGKQSKH
jgi:hypothetical protein